MCKDLIDDVLKIDEMQTRYNTRISHHSRSAISVLLIGVEGIQCSHSPLPGGLQAYPHDFLAEGFFRDQCFVTTASRREQKCYIDYMVRWDGLVRCLDLF